MPRVIELSIAPEKADAVLERLQGMEGVVGLARHAAASLSPPGDIVAVQVANDAVRTVLEALAELEVLDGGSIATNEPRSLLSPRHQHTIDRESNETVWDEMAFMLREDTNLAVNYLALMALAGAVAAVGLWTDTLHIVIASMLIAPAFEPLVRMPFGLIVGLRELATGGLVSAVAGYLMLVLGSLLATFILQLVDPRSLQELQGQFWLAYWSTVTATAVFTSVLGAVAGVLVITGQRSVLTTGVMVALALIPSLSIVGVALAVADFTLAGRGFVRWTVDVGLVVAISAGVIWLKQLLLHRRRALS